MFKYIFPVSVNRCRISSGPEFDHAIVNDGAKLSGEGIGSRAEELESIWGRNQLPRMKPIDLGVWSNLMKSCLLM